MDFAYEYAEMLVGAKFEDLSPQVVETTKRFILDTLGVAFAGCRTKEAKKAIHFVQDMRGKEEASLLFLGDKLPAVNAVFANSVMIHALDFDDTHDRAVVHCYSTNLPAALAICEHLGGVRGKDFLLALNIGIDLTCRLGLAIGSASGFGAKAVNFIRSAVCGGFGACAVAAKLLDFTVDEVVNAFGIMLSQVAGTRQAVVDSAMTKRFQPAFAAKAGVLSAMLGGLGISGCRDVFEGPYGFFNSYWSGDYLREELVRNLGRHFEGINVSFKPYPCCRYNHGAIEAVLQCMKSQRITESEVAHVTVHLPLQPFYDVVSRPFEIRNDPAVDGQFNMAYTVASAIMDGFVFLETFHPETVRQTQRKELADRVKVQIDLPVVDRSSLGPVVVEILTKNGITHSFQVEHFKGSPQNTLNREECIEKFERCIKYEGQSIRKTDMNAVIETVFNLENVEDVLEIIRKTAVFNTG
ncbi:MAG: MmgE/PrpD family protein [Deltaproteobacteria bacterium]|nr:MmgE/PrpD family protein [Deltaproteobacteria bacterium]